MNKLIEMKQWLEISEAAAHLEKCWNEEVSGEDIYQLALEGHIGLVVSTPHDSFARKIKILEDGKIEVGEDTTLAGGEWALPMVEGNPNFIRYTKRHGLFSEPPTGKYLILEDSEGDKFTPVLMGDNFNLSQANRLPDDSVIVVAKEDIISLTERTQGNDTKTVNTSGLPEELQLAISVYYEFWADKPEDTNPASDATIEKFLLKRAGKKIANGSFKRITKIARPEEAKKGGAPKTDQREYKGRSQEK